MQKGKRRLGDLYKRGTELTFDDGEGNGDVVWLEKVSPIDHETALRRANAARARMLMYRNNRDSEEYLAAYGDVCDFGDDRAVLVDYLLQEELAKRQLSAEAELGAEEQWSADNYLEGLRDAWADGLSDRWLRRSDDELDPEATRVFDELKRFADAVDARVLAEAEALRRDYANTDLDDLRHAVAKGYLESQAGAVWMREYQRSLVWLGTRHAEDHKRRYFEERVEVDHLETKVLNHLVRAYNELSVDPTEGKDLRGVPASSPSSEPSGEEGMAPSSGPLAVVP